jgi:DeoR family ulaG and ulaABCDEF operon transcriptional repressor
LTSEAFVSFQELSRRLDASPATLRRDLDRLQIDGKLVRVRGGAQPCVARRRSPSAGRPVPREHQSKPRRQGSDRQAAAVLCRPGDAVIIDGGSTTCRCARSLEPLGLQVLTNSLHIVSALLQQPNTRVSIPGGVVFREQNIVLDPFDDTSTRSFHASRMFVGAAAVNRHGLMQSDIILVQAERKLLALTDEVDCTCRQQQVSRVGGPFAVRPVQSEHIDHR